VSATQPLVLQKGTRWTTFLISPPCCHAGLTVGPDGNIWMPDGGNALWRLTMTGKLKQFPLDPPTAGDNILAVGADNKFYFGNCATPPSIGVGERTSTKIKVTLIPVPSGDEVCDSGLALGPDGNMWFAENSHIAYITTAGIIHEYSYPIGQNFPPGGITPGPDGNMWFTYSFGGYYVGKIVPATGAITLYPVGCQAYGITSAADGNLWAACSFTFVRITTSGITTSFQTYGLGFSMSPFNDDVARAPNGNPWFAGSTFDGCVAAGEINTVTLRITFHKTPLICKAGATVGLSIVTGSDGNVWMMGLNANSHFFASVYIFKRLTVTPESLVFTAGGQSQSLTATEIGSPTLNATSSNSAVARVSTGPAHTFIVKSVGVGTCVIIVADSIGNSFDVEVTVQ
jgi:streptogramin lyase